MSYLGMVITKEKNGDITANQKGYVAAMLERFNVSERAVSVPARADLLGSGDVADQALYHDRREYVSIIMSLMYAARLTYPELMMPVTYLATKCQAPQIIHYKHARWALRYLKGCRNHGLRFTKSDLKLRFHADASFHLHEDGYGHSGFLATLGGNAVMWRSSKQKLQARSSSEAELISTEDCSTYAPFMRRLTSFIGVKHTGPSLFYQDNKSTIIVAGQGGSFKRSKHLVGRFSYLRERITMGDVKLVYVSTKFMLADMLTKPVGRATIKFHLKPMGVIA